MARDFNQNRNTNAKLGQATIDKYGNTFAVQFGLDGINVANVSVQPTPSSIIPYLEGDDTITQFAVPINVDELCDYALASFPNIEELTLFSLTMVTFDETNLLSYLANLDTVYVPQSLLSAYQSAYPNITFEEITVDYTYVVEDYTQDHILTSEIITEQLNALTSQQRNAITKLIIASSYTSDSAESVSWGYTFGTLLPYLNNNIWYNGNKYDFTTRELSGVDELLESDITNLISGISSDKLSGVTQLKFSGFSDMIVALTYDYSDLPNLTYVWLDNARYDVDELEEQLPYDYQKVEYIESTGTQFINSGVAVKSKVSVKAKFSYTKLSGENSIIGGANSGANRGYLISTNTSNYFRLGYGGIIEESNLIANINTLYDYYVDTHLSGSQIVTVNNEQIISTSYQEDFETPYNYYLFAINYIGSPQNRAYAKLYSCEIYDNETKVRNFVPCYRKADNVVGLYDTLNDNFYTDSGLLRGKEVGVTYFYSITDLEQEYDANENQTFYFDYNGTLPSYPNYQLTYYTDINCTISILPENMQSGTRYYAKAVMVTLVIQGSGALTSAIVNQQIAKAGNGVTKVVVPNTFTTFNDGALSVVDNYSELQDLSIEFNLSLFANSTRFQYLYRTANSSNIGKFKYFKINGDRNVDIFREYNYTVKSVIANDLTISNNYEMFGNDQPLEHFELNNLTTFIGYTPLSISSSATIQEILLPKVATIGNTTRIFIRLNLYLPLVQSIGNTALQNRYGGSDNSMHIFFGNNAIISSVAFYDASFNGRITWYFMPPQKLPDTMTNWANKSMAPSIGIIDGADTYTSKGFSYPTLTGIDTEANIQLLTPSDNALYLASDTGNLWQYDSSNSQWVNLFSGYTPSIYSDEDCSISISPSNVTTAMTIYIKLS